MGELGIGLVGLGWMGRRHAEAYLRAPHHFGAATPVPRLVIAADVDAGGRQKALRLGFEESSESWRQVVEHPDVAAVSVTAPNRLHREVAVAAAAAGKHVWIEKPAGRNAVETQEIAAALAAAGTSSLVAFDLRFAPTIRRAQELLRGGHLGEIRQVRASFLTDYAADPEAPYSWRYSREVAGSGALGDLMVHLVGLLGFLLDPIVEVCASATTAIESRPPAEGSGARLAVENEDQVVSLVRFAGGAEGVLEASRIASGCQSQVVLEICGARGTLGWRFDRMNELQVSLGQLPSGDRGRTTVAAGPAHGAFGAFQPAPGLPMGLDDLKVIQAHEFLVAAAGGEPCAPSIEGAVAAALVLAAMERSWAGGGWETVRAR